MSLSRAFREGLDITRIAVPYMSEIANTAGELVYLTIPREDSVVYLEEFLRIIREWSANR